MNKTSLAIVALAIVSATAIGFYAFVQDAQADSLSFSQSNDQSSSILALTISGPGDVGTQTATNTCCSTP
ncbi:MAG: hypothetical protein ACJ71P_12040 [Nitrososphaeraceae archaeon]